MVLVVVLEVFIRVFHLYTEDPPRMIDRFGVERRVPGETGYAVTGNRNMNFSKFSINKNGFNSHRDFEPSENTLEIAIIGDSFIEGFHQDFDKSTGVKLENIFQDSIPVYEYGYAGYDLANQFHLVNAYAKDFQDIDFVVVYLDYPTDLSRSSYIPNQDRIALLSSPLFKLRDNFKLLAYTSKIGVVDKGLEFISSYRGSGHSHRQDDTTKTNKDSIYLANFKSLAETFQIDFRKTYLLLDSRRTDRGFLDYCSEYNIKIIDFGPRFEKSKKPTDLVYDQHWNDYGRTIVAEEIAKAINQEIQNSK